MRRNTEIMTRDPSTSEALTLLFRIPILSGTNCCIWMANIYALRSLEKPEIHNGWLQFKEMSMVKAEQSIETTLIDISPTTSIGRSSIWKTSSRVNNVKD